MQLVTELFYHIQAFSTAQTFCHAGKKAQVINHINDASSPTLGLIGMTRGHLDGTEL